MGVSKSNSHAVMLFCHSEGIEECPCLSTENRQANRSPQPLTPSPKKCFDREMKALLFALFALTVPICAKSPVAQDFISDPYKVKIDDSYYFSLKSGDSAKLMVSDLTSSGTKSPPFAFHSLGSMVSLGDSLIFVADRGNGSEMYRFSPNDKDNKPQLIKGLVANGLSLPQELTVFGDQVFFSASDDKRRELYVFDRKNNLVSTVAAAYKIIMPADPVHLTLVGNKLFFSAGEAEQVKKGKKTKKVYQRRYYMLDTERPSKIHDFPFFDQHTNPKHPVVDGAKLYFKIHEGPERYEILCIDTAAFQPKVEVIGDGSEGFSDCLTVIGDKMYFRGFDGLKNIGNKELWSVDLTQPANRAVLEEEICPGNKGAFPFALTAVEGKLYFNGRKNGTDTHIMVFDPKTKAASSNLPASQDASFLSKSEKGTLRFVRVVGDEIHFMEYNPASAKSTCLMTVPAP